MENEAKKLLVRRYIEMWNTGSSQWADELLAPTWHDHAHPEITSVEQVKEALFKTRMAFPDFHITIETMLSEGNMVALRDLIQARDLSHVIWFVRVADGKLQEMWTGIESANV